VPDKLSIAIVGSRGIPNRYGGFEELAEVLSLELVKKGHELTVYTSSLHPDKSKSWNGVNRILVPDPEDKLGTFGQFIYDLNANLNTREKSYDIILHLGYTSDSIWSFLWPSSSIHITNMDGMEWQRSKFSKAVRRYLKFAEKWVAKRSDYLVADSGAIEKYLKSKYKTPVRFIAYGAEIPKNFDLNTLQSFDLKQNSYDLLIARMEPENNIEMAIEAKMMEGSYIPLIIIGNHTAYGQTLIEKYKSKSQVQFLGPIYNKEVLNALRHFCRYYIHGHSVGGTNPSLLEAMACSSGILAHDNSFNRDVLQDAAFYYSDSENLSKLLNKSSLKQELNATLNMRLERIENIYNWKLISAQYEALFYECLHA